jgi:hypothetical protein
MKTTTSKENPTPSRSSQPFFNKKGEGSCLSYINEVEQPFFSPNPSIQRKPVSSSFSGGNLFAKIPISSSRSQQVIQTKLTINEPGDKYEQEAEAISDRVMRMSAPVGEGGDDGIVQTKPLNINAIQRKCTACEDEEKVQRQEMDEEETLQTKPLMRKAAGGVYTASPQLSSQLNSSKGGGDPLSGKTLGFMNQAFGADFSKVRIHTNSQAAEMNQGIQANAFTHGSDVYFNRGQYSPESLGGKKLLAHELTHVVQQNQGRKNSVIHRQSKTPSNNLSKEYKKALHLLTEYEATWGVIASQTKSFSQVASWIKEGNEVLRLLRIHTESAIRASMKGQSILYEKYLDIIIGDQLVLDLIYYHILVHVNFLHNQPNIQPVWDIINKYSFDGRRLAIAYLEAYEKGLGDFIKNEPNQLGLIMYFNILIDIGDAGDLVESTTISSGSVSATQTDFIQIIAQLILMEKIYKDAIDKINKQLANISLPQMVLLEGALMIAGRSSRSSAPKFSVRGSTPKPPVATKPAAPASKPTAPRSGTKKPKGKKKQATKRPGTKCTNRQHTFYYSAVTTACKGLNATFGCSPQIDSINDMYAKSAKAQACANSRRTYQQVCFTPQSPGWQGHQEQKTSAEKSARLCKEAADKKAAEERKRGSK